MPSKQRMISKIIWTHQRLSIIHLKLGLFFYHFELSIWVGHDSILKIVVEFKVDKKSCFLKALGLHSGVFLLGRCTEGYFFQCVWIIIICIDFWKEKWESLSIPLIWHLDVSRLKTKVWKIDFQVFKYLGLLWWIWCLGISWSLKLND